MLKVGEVAKRTGITVETIRYYEREGLLDPPARTAAGYRLFAEPVLQRISFIQRAKGLGFSLKEILELIALQENPSLCCADVRKVANAKIADIQKRIDHLLYMQQALIELSNNCTEQSEPSLPCPVITALSCD